MESEWENDASKVPAQLRAWLVMGIEIFKAMSEEEFNELLTSVLPDGTVIEVVETIELAAAAGDLAKAGARHSKKDMDLIQSMHDNSVSLGADCSTSKSAQATSLAKAELETSLTKIADLEKQVSDLTKERDRLAALPVPPKGVMRVVDKSADDINAGVKKNDEPIKPDTSNPLAVMKAVHATGGVVVRP